MAESSAIRDAFSGGGRGFVEIVGQIGAGDWERPGLGVWRVRDLVGHTSRALSTVETYLDKGPDSEPDRGLGPAGYYRASRAALADAEAVAQRGRDAGAALGDDPARAVQQLLDRVVTLVSLAADDAAVATPVGVMTLLAYLPTRTFELTVHSLDLARALGLAPPAALRPAVSASCELAGQLAGQLPNATDLLLSMTGRTGLTDRLSVV